jgi:hypothetical protein
LSSTKYQGKIVEQKPKIIFSAAGFLSILKDFFGLVLVFGHDRKYREKG